MHRRPRRNRKTQVIRSLVQETELSVSHLVFPLFLVEGNNIRSEVKSMPGIYRYSLDQVLPEIENCLELGISSFAPFPSISDDKKDRLASESLNEDGLFPSAISSIKRQFPEACLITDVAMDPYSSDGHDGLVEDGKILNDPTLKILADMAVVQARAGTDIIGPSDMMDGRVRNIREALDREGFSEVSIMSYTAKYASAFYGPFRDALDSAPKAGDKKTYQMDPANRQEAMIEARLDIEEGADFLMVKPALAYLDVIREFKRNFDLPIAAYNVSGEYAMISAAAQNGWIDRQSAMLESVLSIRRAGADIILTYFAPELAKILRA